MAEIILGAVNVGGKADVSASNIRVAYAGSVMDGSVAVAAQVVRITSSGASISNGAETFGLAIRIQSVDSPLVSSAVTTMDASRIIKYVKGVPVGVATAKTSAHKYKTISGALIASSSVEAYYGDRDTKGDMHDYLPRYYDEVEEVETLVKSGANESVRMRAKLTEMLDQYYVESSTYGLSRWRVIAGIDDVGARSNGSQRDFINAKLRGVGTVTPALLKSIVDAFYESEVTADVEAYRVGIKIVGKRGVPGNYGDIVKAVDDVIPAHLSVSVDVTYLPWRELDMIRRSWHDVSNIKFEDVSQMKWRDFEGEGIRWGQLSNITFQEIEESFDLNKEVIF